MSAKELLDWARMMGYPGADSPEFQENVHRFCIPNTKPIWRHLMEHMKPTAEVTRIRKQLLSYKLSLEGNLTPETLKIFDNVMNYECYLKKMNLEARIENVNQRVEQKKKQIAIKAIKKLAESDKRRQSDAALQKEKLEKLRLLRLKNSDIMDSVKEFRDLEAINENFMNPNYSVANGNAELARLISSLEPGHEVDQLCSNLTFALQTLAEFVQSERRSSNSSLENENSRLRMTMEADLRQMCAKVVELRGKRDGLAEELDKRRREISDPTNMDLVCRLKATFIQNGRLDSLIASERQAFLRSWVVNNHHLTVDEPSMCSESLLHVDLSLVHYSLSQVFSDLKYHNTFPVTQLRSSITEYINKTRMEAAQCPQVDITFLVEKLMSSLPQLIEKLLKTPNLMKNRSVDEKNPVRNYNNLKFSQSQRALVEKFPPLQLSVKHKPLDPIATLTAIQSAAAKQEKKVHDLCNDLHALTGQLEGRRKAIKSHVEFWSGLQVEASKASSSSVAYTNGSRWED